MHDIEGLKVQPATDSIYLDKVLTQDALTFLVELHKRFNSRRLELLNNRIERQKRLDQGELPDFLPETKEIRDSEWQVAPTPSDLEDRRVEITGPTDAKMIINALNSGAKVFMADLEDATSPTWNNVLDGQVNLQDAVRQHLSYTNPKNNKSYELNKPENLATLLVRPRGWHLNEKNIQVNGEDLSASLFDFGLYFFHNAKERLKRGTAPYFYLPKMESHLEARLWNDVFIFSQNYIGIPVGTIRATCLIETILAAYEMDEILYELKEHSSGLNAGRWDYIFSVIKKFKTQEGACLPDRDQVTMSAPFMKAYTDLLIKTCHRRGAHAIGGMAAFIPSRRDEKVNQIAVSKVNADKTEEARSGCDGTWVAHPDLVPVADAVFTEAFGDRLNQKHILREDTHISAEDLRKFAIAGGKVSEEGVRTNIRIAIQYMNHWLDGLGAVALHNLMEDAATAEISRAQLWQWIHMETKLEDGRTVNPELYSQFRNEELDALGGPSQGHNEEVVKLLDGLVLSSDFTEFLTLPAYRLL